MLLNVVSCCFSGYLVEKQLFKCISISFLCIFNQYMFLFVPFADQIMSSFKPPASTKSVILSSQFGRILLTVFFALILHMRIQEP